MRQRVADRSAAGELDGGAPVRRAAPAPAAAAEDGRAEGVDDVDDAGAGAGTAHVAVFDLDGRSRAGGSDSDSFASHVVAAPVSEGQRVTGRHEIA